MANDELDFEACVDFIMNQFKVCAKLHKPNSIQSHWDIVDDGSEYTFFCS